MTGPITYLRRTAERFHRSETGSLSLEAALILPMLFMVLMFCFMFFDAFDAKSRANKANYTISDYLSRQTNPVDVNFLNGLASLYRFLNNEGDIDMRVSAVKYTLDGSGNGIHTLSWSYAVGDLTALTNETVSEVENRLPVLAVGEEVLLIETARPWHSPFDVLGLDGQFTFTDVVTTKPRFATQVPFDSGTS